MTCIEQDYYEAVKRIARNMEKREIDWEQRRYEIATAMMSSTYFGGNNGSPLYWEMERSEKGESKFAEMAQFAVKAADALIKELKK